VTFDRRFFLGVHDPDPDVLDREDADYWSQWLAHRHDEMYPHAREAEPTETRHELDQVSSHI
jgi:hypothetical protein